MTEHHPRGRNGEAAAARRRGGSSVSPTRRSAPFIPPQSPRQAAAAALSYWRAPALVLLLVASTIGLITLSRHGANEDVVVAVGRASRPGGAARAATTTAHQQQQQHQRRRRALLAEADSAAATTANAAIAPSPPPLLLPSSSAHPSPPPPRLLDLAARCHGAEGPWCAAFYTQRPLPPRLPPVHGKRCPGDCSAGLGVCHADSGRCDCPAGWRGEDCSSPDPRPCTNRYRERPGDPSPASHIGPDGRDLDVSAPGFTYSRCAGVCDAETGACYCGGDAHGRRPAPAGSPPGTPPLREGRPLASPCSWLTTDAHGKPVGWGGPPGVPWHSLYGPKGWCQADAGEAAAAAAAAVLSCGCALDGRGGPLCDLPAESYCPNQCSGHGECARGFCRCARGWYGLDCARRAAWADEEDEDEGDEEAGTLAAAAANAPDGAAAFAAMAAAGDQVPLAASTGGGADGRPQLEDAAAAAARAGPPRLLPPDADVVAERPWLEEVTVDPWSRAQVPAHALIEAAAAASGQGGGAGGTAAAAEQAGAAAAAAAEDADLALALEGDDLFAASGGDVASLTAAALAEALEGMTIPGQGEFAGGFGDGDEGRDEDAGEAARIDDNRRRRQRQRRRLHRYFWAGAGAGPWRPPARRSRQQRRRVPSLGEDDGADPALSFSLSSSSSSSSTGGGGGLQEWGGQSLVRMRRASATRARPQRLRPRIFVYDMPAPFVSRMLQYRAVRGRCTWRVFGTGAAAEQEPATAATAATDGNGKGGGGDGPGLRGGAALNATDFSPYAYPTESLLHELLLRSEHRTLDPEEADFFYVPFYASCFVDGVFGAADAPWWHSPSKSRVKGASVMAAAALEWVRTHHPYWDRKKGADHVWLFSHDEGACWAPAEVLSSGLVLTHWGRGGGGKGGWALGGTATALPVSEAPDPQLNYTINIGDDPRLGPGGVDLFAAAAATAAANKDGRAPAAAASWHEALGIGTQPCHDASSGRHLVIPAFRPPPHYHGSPFLGAPEPRNAPRDVLLLLRGEMGVAFDGEEDEEGNDGGGANSAAAAPPSMKERPTRPPSFSRGVRQRLARAARAGRWRQRHNVWVAPPKVLARYAGRAGTASALAALAASRDAGAGLAGSAGAAVAASTSGDGDYSRMLARSVFCLVAPGEGGWTGLFEDAVLHGCIPVWMTDGVRPPFDAVLKWRDFSLELREADAERLPEILAAVSPRRVAEMQRRLALLWHRFAWLAHPLLRRAADEALRRNHARGEWIAPALELHAGAARRRPAVGSAPGVAPLPGDGGGVGVVEEAGAGGGGEQGAGAGADTGAAAAVGGPERWISPLGPEEAQDDAFATILQWLYSRMPDVVAQQKELEQQQQQQQQQGEAGAGASGAAAADVSGPAAARLPPHRRAVASWEVLQGAGPTVRHPDLELESDGPFADEGPSGLVGPGGGSDDDASGGGSGAGADVVGVLSSSAADADALEIALWDGRPLLDDGKGGALLTRFGEDPARERNEKQEARWAQRREQLPSSLAAAISAAGTAEAGGGDSE